MPSSDKSSYSIKSLFFFVAFSAILLLYSFYYSANGQDFVQDWVAAKNLIASKSIYGEDFRHSLDAILGQKWISNDHPPSSVWLYIPFALLNFNLAVFFFSFSNILLLIILFNIISKDKSSHITLILLSAYPLVCNLMLFQNSLFIATLLLSGLHMFNRNKLNSAAILWALACSLKLFPGLIFLLFLYAKRIRPVITGLLTYGVTLIPFIIIGNPEDILTYFRQSAASNFYNFINYPINNSVWGVMSTIFCPYPEKISALSISDKLLYLTSLTQIIILLAGIKISYTHYVNKRLSESFHCLIAICLILSPIFWQHYYLLLLAANFMIFRDLYLKGKNRMLVLLLIAFSNFPDIEYYNYLYSNFNIKEINLVYLLAGKTYLIASILVILILRLKRTVVD